MFYEVHILDGGTVFKCEADVCLAPDEDELIERAYHDEDNVPYYSIMHKADWDAAPELVADELEALV